MTPALPDEISPFTITADNVQHTVWWSEDTDETIGKYDDNLVTICDGCMAIGWGPVSKALVAGRTWYRCQSDCEGGDIICPDCLEDHIEVFHELFANRERPEPTPAASDEIV